MREWVELLMRWIEGAGIGVITVGLGAATVLFLRAIGGAGHPFETEYILYRRRLGQAILLGLELLVAADIVGTVALEPTLQSISVLGLIVLVRTFLSMALEVEMEGRWPWNRAAARE
ncbi:MAG: DUF1622 domain-containing protein [Acidobacteriota bacterium]|nr:DUF1622 domain-containing protein [Acidobacteriota bacterium]